MKNIITTFLVSFSLLAFNINVIFAEGGSRGLWASKSQDGKSVFVSWRMRSTDAPKSTTYKLFADGNLVSTLTDKTNVQLSTQYQNSTFSLEVYDNSGNKIDSQTGVKCTQYDYHPIQLNHPGTYNLSGGTVTYSPYDCSAYDMDGDGEQEIIMCWEGGTGALATATAPPILDCIKLDGTLLWRINLGPNVLAGCRFTFLCYDFDGDGYGELIVKTAQGSKDATGNFLSKGAAAGANHYASSINGAGVITDAGKEWITCFDGRTGKELATVDYWPYFNIQNDWDDRSGNYDRNDYGHRGNWFKGCVAFLNVDGKPKPCAVTNRGIYTYSYAAAYTWDGTNLSTLWRHTSDRSGQGIYGQGAHSITCGDVDNDGFDEIIVGAACLDHDGKLLWRTGLGHGDATHLGEFDPTHEGLEYFMITEESNVSYNSALLDAKTGRVLAGRPQTGGDTGRGMILDCDDRYEGAEYFDWSDEQMFSCKDQAIALWHVGSTNSSSINFRIFFDGDLYEEYTDRGHVDSWNSGQKTWERVYVFGYNNIIDGTKVQWAANTNNDTKYNCCLQADIIGDWREESIFWTKVNGKYFLTIYPTTIPSDYKLPWLRDDHIYDMAVAWQNCGYNQPPHLGYSPVEYYKQLSKVTPPASLTKHGEGSSSQSVRKGDPIVNFSYSWENATGVTVSGLPNGVTYSINNAEKTVYISGVANDNAGDYNFVVTTVGNDENTVKNGVITILPESVAEISSVEGILNQTVYQDSAIAELKVYWNNATNVQLQGDAPNGIYLQVDENNHVAVLRGTVEEQGMYKYCICVSLESSDTCVCGSIEVIENDLSNVSLISNSKEFFVAPNPMDDYTEVTFTSLRNQKIRWFVQDISGAVCSSDVAYVWSGQSNFKIDVSALPAGIYFLRIEGDDFTANEKIFVK